MVILSALLDCLVSKEILTTDDRKEVNDLYSLARTLEGAANRLLSHDEQSYVKAVNKCLEEGRKDLNPLT